MINEEDFLNSKMGKRNPFTVPEGYFEQLTQHIMDQIPQADTTETQAVTREMQPLHKPARVAVMKRLRPWLYAAACICVGVFMNKPVQSSELLALNIYQTAFKYNNMAQGQAKAVLFFVVLTIFSVIQVSYNKSKEVEA